MYKRQGQTGGFGFGSGLTQKFAGFSGSVFFGVRVEKIVFRTQNFRAGSGRVYGSGQFLAGLIAKVNHIVSEC